MSWSQISVDPLRSSSARVDRSPHTRADPCSTGCTASFYCGVTEPRCRDRPSDGLHATFPRRFFDGGPSSRLQHRAFYPVKTLLLDLDALWTRPHDGADRAGTSANSPSGSPGFPSGALGAIRLLGLTHLSPRTARTGSPNASTSSREAPTFPPRRHGITIAGPTRAASACGGPRGTCSARLAVHLGVGSATAAPRCRSPELLPAHRDVSRMRFRRASSRSTTWALTTVARTSARSSSDDRIEAPTSWSRRATRRGTTCSRSTACHPSVSRATCLQRCRRRTLGGAANRTDGSRPRTSRLTRARVRPLRRRPALAQERRRDGPRRGRMSNAPAAWISISFAGG